MFRRRDEEENNEAQNQGANTTEFGGNTTRKEPKMTTEDVVDNIQEQKQNSSLFSKPVGSSKPQTQKSESPSSKAGFTSVAPKPSGYKLGNNGAFSSSSPSSSSPSSRSASSGSNSVSNVEGVEAERRLTVGYGISLEGKVSDCDKLIIYGIVNAELNNVKSLHISESGKFTGSANIDNAEISGTFEGDINVKENIIINSTGRVNGKITYGSIEIKPGGKFTGEIVEASDLVEEKSEKPSKTTKKTAKKTAETQQLLDEEFTLAPEPLEGVEKEEAVA